MVGNQQKQEKIFKKKDKWHRLNGSVFCNMSLGEVLTITFINMTQVSCVGGHRDHNFDTGW